MSQQKVELVRQAWAAQSRHDHEAVLEYDLGLRLLGGVGCPGTASYRGFDAIREWFRDLLGAFESLDAKVEEWIDARDEAITIAHFWGGGRQSGIPIEGRHPNVWKSHAASFGFGSKPPQRRLSKP